MQRIFEISCKKESYSAEFLLLALDTDDTNSLKMFIDR